MKTVSFVRALANTSSRLEKEAILTEAWNSGERDLFNGFKLCYDILLSFGVKKVAEICAGDSSFQGTTDWEAFNKLAEQLSTRQLTGNAARDAIHLMAENTNCDLWNEFYRRIILKDMRCGVSDTTINKLLEKIGKKDPEALTYLVPSFGCQLAKDGNDESNSKKIRGKKMLDVKLDGVRLLTIIDKENNTITQYTRNGLVNTNFTEITESLTAAMDNFPFSVVLDGEVVAENFQSLMTQVNRKSNKNTSSAKLALFDIIPLADFRKGISKIKQSVRHTTLSGYDGILRVHTEGRVYVIPKVTVDLDTPEGRQTFKEFNRAAIEDKYEGVMVKDPDAPYETRRTASWLKIKPWISVDLAVEEVVEGTGKYVGMMGAVHFFGVDQEKTIRVSVGSGWSDEDRAQIWKDRAKMLGMIGEIMGDCLTLEQGAIEYAIRFPRFKCWRGSKPGEKI